MRRMLNDAAIGVRLAVGGGRTSLTRFALSSIGIAVAVAVLLIAASVGTMTNERALRDVADVPVTDRVEGVDPVYVRHGGTVFRGEWIDMIQVHPSGPRSPVPIGMPRLPRQGEMYASPALADLLRSPDGNLLRPRLPEKVVGTIDKSMVSEPDDLLAYVGGDGSLADSMYTDEAYSFGISPSSREFGPEMMALLLVGAVALLLPVFLFVSTASRIAGAERDRRLSALRLVGSDARQVRRIAAAESLVSTFAGLVIGGLIFLVARQFAEQIEFFDRRTYVSDVVPHPVLIVFILVVVPAISLLSAMFALRRTIIEPLGVVRQGRPMRRRLWWRLVPIVLGIGLLATQGGFPSNTDMWAAAITVGASLVLIGVPVLLPWLVEWVAGRLRGGPTSWQLAIRRLQLDSGTPARIVGVVAVVLSGAIALQTILMTAQAEAEQSDVTNDRPPGFEIAVFDVELADKITADARTASGVTGVYQVRYVTAYQGQDPFLLAVLDCVAMRVFAGVKSCENGNVFVQREYASTVPVGTSIEFRDYPEDDDTYTVLDSWTVPENIREVDQSPASNIYAQLLATPAALDDIALPDWGTTLIAEVTPDLTPTQLEGIRNAIAEYRWDSNLFAFGTAQDPFGAVSEFSMIRAALYSGAVFTLLLAGVSLLVLALEHIRERRRPIAVLAASGVPRSILGRSLLWQITVPIALGIGVALLTGIGLAVLIVRLTGGTLSVDWSGMALLCAGALALSVLVSAMTLPFLRSATRLTALRAE